MNRLKLKQLGNWCSFCPSKSTKATHRQDNWLGKFCCDDHKQDLVAYEKREADLDKHLSEADYQTWVRL